MARPSGSTVVKSRVKTRIVSSSDESSSDGASDGQVDHQSEDDSEEVAAVARKQKGANGTAKTSKRRVVQAEEDDDSSNESDEDSQNRVVATSKSGKGKVNNSRAAKSSAESSKSGGSSSKASLNNAQMQPLQPHNAQPRSPFRTVSLNDASPGGTKRRLSNSRLARADDLRRQSLPSNLRKQTNAQDPDASFASNTSSLTDTSRRGSGAGGGHGTPSKQSLAHAQLRRTSAGYALQGGGIGALNAAAALKRHASGASTGTSANDLPAQLPQLTIEAMNSNYEEWMKMATDNVSVARPLYNPQHLIALDWLYYVSTRKSMLRTPGISPLSTTSMIWRSCAMQTMKAPSTSRRLLAL